MSFKIIPQMEYLWDKIDRGDAKRRAIHFSKPTFRSVSQIAPRITVAMPYVSKSFILRVWLSARPQIFKISAIHEPVAFSLLSLRSRQILHTLNLREAQSARSNILEQTITSSPSHSQPRRLYLCTELQASKELAGNYIAIETGAKLIDKVTNFCFMVVCQFCDNLSGHFSRLALLQQKLNKLINE